MKDFLENIDIIDINEYAEKVKKMSQNMESLFSDNARIHRTAYLSWNMRDIINSEEEKLIFLADSYYFVSKKTLEECFECYENRDADRLIFPILFCFIQTIELYFKAIIIVMEKISEEKDISISKYGHNLKKLYEYIKKRMEKEEGSEQLLTGLNLIYNFINNIYDKTNDLTFVRYPYTNKGEEQFYLKQREVIDLDILYENMEYVYDMLVFIYGDYSRELENMEEIRNSYLY